MKPPNETSPHLLVVGSDGRLKTAVLPVDPAAAVARLEDTVLSFVRDDDSSITKRIAAGSAAAEIFARKHHRTLGLTKSGYCKARFNRSARSVDSWIAASAAYEAIGGISCTTQPTSVNQLEVLGKIHPENRCRAWNENSTPGGPPPTPEVLIGWAEVNGVVAKKPRRDPYTLRPPSGKIRNDDDAIALLERLAQKAEKRSKALKRSLKKVLRYLRKRQRKSAQG